MKQCKIFKSRRKKEWLESKSHQVGVQTQVVLTQILSDADSTTGVLYHEETLGRIISN